MILKRLGKKILITVFKQFDKDYLIEYWRIKKNEPNTLSGIIKFYDGFICPDMNIIDVGANIGHYSQVFLHLGANVVAIEPQSYCQKILETRFKLNPLFILIKSATGERISTSVIHKSSSHTVASMNKNWIDSVTKSNRFKTEKWHTSEQITVTTLDTVIKEHVVPDYIKIDVEGYELSVLKGLTHSVNYISFEITLPESKQTALDCVDFIDTLGSYVFSIPDRDRLIDVTNWKTKNELIREIDRLCLDNEFVSTDIYAKKITH